jgi:hypothetical protein
MSAERGFERWAVENLPVEDWPPDVYAWAIEHRPPSEWPPFLTELVERVPEEERATWPAWKVVGAALRMPVRLPMGGSTALTNDRREAARALSRNEGIARELDRLRMLRGRMMDADPGLDRSAAERRLFADEILPFAQSFPVSGVTPPDVAQYLLIALRFDTTDPEWVAPFLFASQAIAYANFSDSVVEYPMRPGEILISVTHASRSGVDLAWPAVEAAKERLQHERPKAGLTRSNLRERIYRRTDELRTPSAKGRRRSFAKIAPMINREFRDELENPLSEIALQRGYERWVKKNAP